MYIIINMYIVLYPGVSRCVRACTGRARHCLRFLDEDSRLWHGLRFLDANTLVSSISLPPSDCPRSVALNRDSESRRCNPQVVPLKWHSGLGRTRKRHSGLRSYIPDATFGARQDSALTSGSATSKNRPASCEAAKDHPAVKYQLWLR